MAKSKRAIKSKYPSRVQYKKRKKGASPLWLSWTLVMLVIVVVLIGWGIVRSLPEGDVGPRENEMLFEVTGTSYDGGETSYAYPNPQDNAGQRKWLPALGDVDAPVLVMEFSDIFCSHCRAFNLDNLEGILQDYVATGKVRYVDHFFGFSQSIELGVVEAQLCAAEQGRFFEFKHALFQTVDAGDFNLDGAARNAGINMKLFNACRDDDRYESAVQEMVSVDNMGVNATPTYFVNGQKISGNRPDEIRQLIDEALASGSSN